MESAVVNTETPIDLKVTVGMVQTILAALSEVQFKVAAPVVQAVQLQAQAQIDALNNAATTPVE